MIPSQMVLIQIKPFISFCFLIPFSENTGATTTSSCCSLLDAVNDDTLLEYIRIRYSSFYSVNTNPVALLIDTLIASDESNFASLSSETIPY